jgi:ariadne-1
MRCSFVDLNPHAKWCPRPGCENCVENIKGGRRDIVCACGMNWCWACQNESHAPALCTQVLRWEKKMCDESGTESWIKTHTKQVGARPPNAPIFALVVVVVVVALFRPLI